ncbi:MAG: 3-hydroxybutyryl-CoA dehydrogenase [Chloroflexota bacterium]|nr:3-hydroxybutyryl-CoA dehydrogenase [Chloroflexota bacterium]
MEVKKAGVVGCGIMGGGIAQVCAQSGYETVVLEISDELLNKGLASIKKILDKNVQKGKLSAQECDTIMGRFKGTTNYSDFGDCDIVIEAATENLELKKKIFIEMDKVCPDHAVLATNTSSVSVLDLAMVTQRPDKVCGIHFMNPVPIMAGVELVRSILTSEEALANARSFTESLGKKTWVSKDAPGFIANRLFLPYILDAIRMLESGFATKEDIDLCMKLSFNYPMGPFTLSDMVGVDTLFNIAEGMFEEFKDPKFAAPILLRKMVKANHLGRKTGKGFYDYS